MNTTRPTDTENCKHGEVLHAHIKWHYRSMPLHLLRTNGLCSAPKRLSVAGCEERPCRTRRVTQGLLPLLLQTPHSFLWHTQLSRCSCRQCFPWLPSLMPADPSRLHISPVSPQTPYILPQAPTISYSTTSCPTDPPTPSTLNPPTCCHKPLEPHIPLEHTYSPYSPLIEPWSSSQSPLQTHITPIPPQPPREPNPPISPI